MVSMQSKARNSYISPSEQRLIMDFLLLALNVGFSPKVADESENTIYHELQVSLMIHCRHLWEQLMCSAPLGFPHQNPAIN